MNTKILYTVLFYLLTYHGAYSQWVQTGGPYGTARINAIIVNNSRLYAATSCGLHSTGSLTDHWDLKTTLPIATYIKKGSLLYFGASKSGIQRLDFSEPGFVPVPVGLPGVSVITIKDEGSCLYAGIEGQGFATSMGYTSEWNFYNAGLPAEIHYYPPEQGGGSYYVRVVHSIETMDNTIFCGTHLGVYRADKAALMWSRAGTGLPQAPVQQLKVLEGNLYACQGSHLYVSEDKGDNWKQIHDFGTTLSSVERINDYLFVTTLGNGLWLSPNQGQTWMPQNNGLTDLKVTTLTLVENTPVCGTETQGVFYYNGTSWVHHSKGIICSDIRAMSVMDNSLVTNDGDQVYMATGTTSAWRNLAPVPDKKTLGFVCTMNDRILLSYQSADERQHIKHTNGADAWQDLPTSVPFAGDDPYRMKVDSNRLYVYENGLLYYTDDKGATWGNGSLPETYCNDIYDFTVYHHTPFAASCGIGELLRLSDNRTWGLSNSGLPNGREITSMAYSANALYAYSYTNGVFISKDEGQSWTRTSDGFYADWNIRSFAFYEDILFLTTVKGVYYSTDFGQHWNQMNEGLKNNNVGPLVISNDTLYVGTHGNGVWKHDLVDFIPPKKDSIPQALIIRIFPNPATQFVRFDFPDYDKATIELIDLLGRKMVSTRLETDRQISVAGLSSGTYLIIITTDRFTYHSKLIIKREEGR